MKIQGDDEDDDIDDVADVTSQIQASKNR